MVQKATKGINISVKTVYKGPVFERQQLFYYFSYYILVENNSDDSIQLLERFWSIHDSLKDTNFVQGIGVVGKTPIIKAKESYSYTSNCFLSSTIGAMNGKYKMLNTDTGEQFFVPIPTFQLATESILN
ncbi:Co2+/Mg2+ efflux protein ApaG [Tenacibaculum sp. SG-28]|uniref:Co2+/Mg2+ efflux protein ApaG n=1 Tax=Tenacibaculum sp. SG-28 TaxID=754426 RepID=UPI000CF50F68|nr:Co2+/Mg2+ efflux protein ApaG [Tenacibaculum sp. SG-28]PQJ21190.1 Co2+/Mg2+ efflux protein ApaG [Tenacibaculum sp. SG-28]